MSEALLLKEDSMPPQTEESEIKKSDLDTIIVSEEELQNIKKTRRLKELQDKIDKGEYAVTAEEIADSILSQD